MMAGCDNAITVFAGVPGLEPRLTEPESVVLPITPYPNWVSVSAPHANKSIRKAGGVVVDYRVSSYRTAAVSMSCLCCQ